MMTTPENSNPIIFKFDFCGQQYELKSLTSSNTIGELRALVSTMLGFDNLERLALKTLHPTAVIDHSEDSKKLNEVFRQKREKIVVERALTTTKNIVATSNQNNDIVKSSKNNSLKTDRESRDGRLSSLSSSPDLKSLQPSLKQLKQNENNQSQDQASHQPVVSSSNPPQNSVPTVQNNLERNSPQHEQIDDIDDDENFPVCSSTGYLLRHPVPSNNSCLFISIHFCLTGGLVDPEIGNSMRQIIADTVASDKDLFDDAFLGKSNPDYCTWILNENHWGGAIELMILCKYYKTEIVAIDVKNGFKTQFGEDCNYPKRMLLLYDGLHYDPLKFQPLDDNKPVLTLFSTQNLEVLNLASELASEARQSHQFTDLNQLTLKCSDCDAELSSKGASEHAERTGHVNFSELHT